MSHVKKKEQSKKSKRTLNLLEQLVRNQVEIDIENMDKEKGKVNKKKEDTERKMHINGDVRQNGYERKGREKTKKSKHKVKESSQSKNIHVPDTSSPKQSRSRSRSPSSSSSFWSNGRDSRSRSRSYSHSRSRSSSQSRSGSRSRSYSRSRSRSYSRSSSRSDSRSRSRSRSRSPETPRSKSSEEPSQSTTKSLPVPSVKARDKDVMSDIVTSSSKKKPPTGHRQGKLLKRRQMKKYRSFEIDPDAFIEERLTQKYRELEDIVKGKSLKTNTITRQYIGQMEMLREQYHMVSHGLAPPGVILPRSLSQEMRNKGHQNSHYKKRPLSGESYNSELSNKSTDMAYRSMQNIIKDSRNPKHEYLSKKHKKRSKRKNSESTIDNSSFHSHNTATTQKTGSTAVTTPRDIDEQERMNYHLKYSSKEELRIWLKKKDKLYRKKVKEEKAKKRAEREQMVLEANEKFEKRLEAQKIYKKWADQKNKEIADQKRKERKEHKRILKEYEEKNEKKNIRPESAPLRRKDPSTPGGIKVEGTPETNVNIREKSNKSPNDSALLATPHPPTSKFIYKRPVAGRIKLAVNGNSPHGQKSDQERPKTASSSRSKSAEGNRMSYDQWVSQKRKQDQKKKELEEKHKQDQMSKSDPDLNKLIPDIARKRVHNVLEGKKRIDTGVKRIDDKLNKKFGGADFDSERKESEASENVRYSYRLESDRTENPNPGGQINVSGKAIKRPPTGTRRPQTAPAGRVPPPKKSSGSPRQAVVPKLEDVMNEENSSNPFKVPFPAEAGVPKHVASRQRKLFAEQIWERLEGEERPEPQGSDVPEPATCVGMGSPPANDSKPETEDERENENKDKTESSRGKSESEETENEESKKGESEESKVFLTQFNSIDNLNKIENTKFEGEKTEDSDESPVIEKLNLDFNESSQREDESDSEQTSTDRDQKEEEKSKEKDESTEEKEESLKDDKGNDKKESEQNGDDNSNESNNSQTEKDSLKNVDILNLDLENMTRSSKRVSFNEAPEVFQTEDWSTDTQTPDEENFKSELEDSTDSSEKQNVTFSDEDDF
ncbi:E3 ubiquitin-protein ligase RBBP6-like [Saccostrea echinata]|uniref:E3 ubiquitin-protein ligase RBBP6-like n=1 Tax=Saccostrea echinata TaxID=191078 RepID=UPI002A7EE7C8|nr:E3 ubiquitin-protein ligase RBBP6-like [Saccostrea echinata]